MEHVVDPFHLSSRVDSKAWFTVWDKATWPVRLSIRGAACCQLNLLFAHNWSRCSLKPFYKWSTIGASSFTLMFSQKEKGMLNRFILTFTLSWKRKSGQSTDMHVRSSPKMSCFGSQLSHENDVLLDWVGFFMRMSCCI